MRVFGAATTKRTERPARALALAAAGPLVIVALVVIVLHDVVFGGLVPPRNPDLLAFWMPNQCLLGEELTSGRIPYWNPYALAGTPFAADPQSGWMYLPMMALAPLGCDAALRALVAFFPLLGGLGAYAFLRSEGASRVAATVAGVALAGVMAGSALAVTMTFAGFMAWTPWLLAATSRALRSRTWSGRLLWLAVACLVWGQVAAAHISNGLVMGSALVGVFWIYRSIVEVRAARVSARTVAALTGLAILLLLAVNAAYLLPRIAYLERSTIGLGYEGLFELRNELWRLPPADPPTVRVTEPDWILRLATSPGAYLGAFPLALSLAALFSRRWRGLALVLGGYALVFYVAGIGSVAEVLQPLMEDTFLGDFYGHAPARFGYAPILALCLLAGLGVESWRSTATGTDVGAGRRAAMLLPGLVLWGALPIAAGAVPGRMLLPAVAVLVALPLLFFARASLAWTGLIALLAVELTINGLHGQSRDWERAPHGLTDPKIVGVEPLNAERVDVSEFRRVLPALRDAERPDEGRWLALEPSLYELGRQMVHEVHEVQGYNPVQLRRYWIYTRAIERRGVDPRPRMTVFRDLPSPRVLDLLNVRYVVQREGSPAAAPGNAAAAGLEGAEVLSEDPQGTLWQRDAAPGAVMFSSYELWPSPQENLTAVTDPSFEPDQLVIVEGSGVSAAVSHSAPEPAPVRWLDPSTVEIAVGPGLVELDLGGYLLVKIPYDDHWRAEVDGAAREVLPGNYFLQAVKVEPGDRIVRLSYRDPWVTRGLWGTGTTLATVGIACGLLALRRRRRRPTTDGTTSSDHENR